ncbi:MAG: hypothetical protein OEY57_10975 [Nitrospirota bacterium]|nr:hypothetical protein [Nitrospirota bacterium]
MNALYYPFHLCHVHTLEHLLADYQTVHFRDFMALQLTPMMGTTAFPDRMGDYYPEDLQAGRIIQGYNVSGAMAPEIIRAIDQDLADRPWRTQFQKSLLKDSRFQRGLFGDPHAGRTGSPEAPSKPEWHQFREEDWAARLFNVETVRALSRKRLHGEELARFEYGWALIKTSASLMYTIQLCHQHGLVAVTDSSAHHDLLTRTCEREQFQLEHSCIKREGY